MTTINFARDFTTTPGGRFLSDGPKSGEAFRKDILGPALQRGGSVTVDLSGPVLGYPASFLEEAFGGAVREFGAPQMRGLKLTGDAETMAEIRGFISDAEIERERDALDELFNAEDS